MYLSLFFADERVVKRALSEKFVNAHVIVPQDVQECYQRAMLLVHLRIPFRVSVTEAPP